MYLGLILEIDILKINDVWMPLYFKEDGDLIGYLIDLICTGFLYELPHFLTYAKILQSALLSQSIFIIELQQSFIDPPFLHHREDHLFGIDQSKSLYCYLLWSFTHTTAWPILSSSIQANCCNIISSAQFFDFMEILNEIWAENEAVLLQSLN